jgi:DNA-binding Lrp family transcriptional regulator
MLKFLSINGRASIDSISRFLKLPKTTAYALFNEVAKEYKLHFVPELDLEDIWKYEFVKISKHHSTKREMREEALEKIPDLGCEEYMAFVKFNGAIPSDDEIINALNNSYVPQFVAKLHGGYDLVLYLLGKNFYEVNKALINFAKNLKSYNAFITASRIITDFGFFPIRNEFVDKLLLSENAKALIEGLNIDGRGEIKDIGIRFNKKPELLLYAMERLKKGGLLKRITYFEAQPKSNINGIISIAITNESKFIESRENWFLEIVKSKPGEHTKYVYICDTLNPFGILVFVNLKSNEDIDTLVSSFRKTIKGAEINYITITKILMGNLGIRNFDMHYSPQYKYLESKNLVPRINRNEA